MTTTNHAQTLHHDLDPAAGRIVFDDPVAYLENLGVTATVVAVTTLPAAA
jgi:hypothetical protein